jgi:hypothetical protein
MNTQNILNFYGYKLDVKLDSSEFYDYELDNNLDNFNKEILNLTTPINYEKLVIDSSCLIDDLNDIKPWVITIDEQYTEGNCDFLVRNRTEDGWTLSMTFNKTDLEFSDGKTFYYWGIQNETDESIFADNNLSFSFTNDGEIIWESYRYSGYCQVESGYTETYYLSTGKTPSLCSNGVLTDFNITIVFNRNFNLENCDIQNNGGINDLIVSSELDTELNEWFTGDTFNTIQVEELNKKWNSEREYRLGTLRIFLNGYQIYKIDDWEEIIPSKRGSENDIVQIFGGGTTGFLNIHTGDTLFNILDVKYYEESFNPLNVKHYYLTEIKPNYNITECNDDCADNVYSFVNDGILMENGDNLITEDNNMIIY